LSLLQAATQPFWSAQAMLAPSAIHRHFGVCIHFAKLKYFEPLMYFELAMLAH
jgi:hypothetical protein